MRDRIRGPLARAARWGRQASAEAVKIFWGPLVRNPGDDEETDRPLTEIAFMGALNQVLRSSDIWEAAKQAETSQSELERIVASSAHELLSRTSPVESLDFRQEIDLDALLEEPALYARAGAVMVPVAVAAIINLGSWGLASWVLATVTFALAAVGGITVIPVLDAVDSFRGQLELAPESRDELLTFN